MHGSAGQLPLQILNDGVALPEVQNPVAPLAAPGREEHIDAPFPAGPPDLSHELDTLHSLKYRSKVSEVQGIMFAGRSARTRRRASCFAQAYAYSAVALEGGMKG